MDGAHHEQRIVFSATHNLVAGCIGVGLTSMASRKLSDIGCSEALSTAQARNFGGRTSLVSIHENAIDGPCDVLVLGRVHVVAQRGGGGPQLGLEAEVGAGGGRGGCCAGHESIPGVDGVKFGTGNPAPQGAIARVGGEHAGGAASAVGAPVDEGYDLVVGGLVQSRMHSLSLIGL